LKRLLLPLLAALALPTAVNAEVAGYYLVGIADRKPFVVPMKTLELCEEAGKKFGDNKNGLLNLQMLFRLLMSV